MDFDAEDTKLANGAAAGVVIVDQAPSAAGAAGTAAVAEAFPPASDPGADAGSEPPVNPRKRKKASRAYVAHSFPCVCFVCLLALAFYTLLGYIVAHHWGSPLSSCDFCHVNHQPCDNGKPKCSVCQKHNKPCLYLRPTKRRGPQKGYRTALNTYKESAAAWGAVLGAIPGLDALIEGHLRNANGKYITASIKDASQQEVLINKWQESSVFKAFFGHNNPAGSVQGDNGATSQDAEAEDDDYPGAEDNTPVRPAPARRLLQSPTQHTHPTTAGPSGQRDSRGSSRIEDAANQRDINSLSDIVARDAAQSSVVPCANFKWLSYMNVYL